MHITHLFLTSLLRSLRSHQDITIGYALTPEQCVTQLAQTTLHYTANNYHLVNRCFIYGQCRFAVSIVVSDSFCSVFIFLTDIDWDKKVVVISDNIIIPYDYLVLTPGRQHKPIATQEKKTADPSKQAANQNRPHSATRAQAARMKGVFSPVTESAIKVG